MAWIYIYIYMCVCEISVIKSRFKIQLYIESNKKNINYLTYETIVFFVIGKINTSYYNSKYSLKFPFIASTFPTQA